MNSVKKLLMLLTVWLVVLAIHYLIFEPLIVRRATVVVDFKPSHPLDIADFSEEIDRQGIAFYVRSQTRVVDRLGAGISNCTVMHVDGHPQISSQATLRFGERPLSAKGRGAYAWITDGLANQLFKTSRAVDREIFIRGQRYTVKGVFNSADQMVWLRAKTRLDHVDLIKLNDLDDAALLMAFKAKMERYYDAGGMITDHRESAKLFDQNVYLPLNGLLIGLVIALVKYMVDAIDPLSDQIAAIKNEYYIQDVLLRIDRWPRTLVYLLSSAVIIVIIYLWLLRPIYIPSSWFAQTVTSLISWLTAIELNLANFLWPFRYPDMLSYAPTAIWLRLESIISWGLMLFNIVYCSRLRIDRLVTR